jgi:hypothetical protein
MRNMMKKASSAQDTLLMFSVPLVSLSSLTVVSSLLCHSVTGLAIGVIGVIAAMAIQFHEPGKSLTQYV